MKVLVTGVAGFIGYYTSKALLEAGYEVVGIDNLNSYYDIRLKLARLENLGIDGASATNLGSVTTSLKYEDFHFQKLDITKMDKLRQLFVENKFSIVINLAAQAGVRYSLENPFAYIQSNIVGFSNLLECCRAYPVEHLVYASSSSVYGRSNSTPYKEDDMTDCPASLYAATKKSNELMAYTYSQLYGIPSTGLRFFTVYGPWGRPDMAPYMFMKSVLKGKPIQVFNHGDLQRDFTYIDDIIRGVMAILPYAPTGPTPHTVYNIGNASPVELMTFIHTIERIAGKQAELQMQPMQPGDVYCTYADISRLQKNFDFCPDTTLDEGLQRFYDWFCSYHHINKLEN
ncbi:MAG: NAD-dependent epimerase/dehydratase family protein [Bacteroidaceae bacterium]